MKINLKKYMASKKRGKMKTLYNLRAFEITCTFVVLPGLFKLRNKPLYIQQAIQHSHDIASTGKMRLVRIRYRLAIFVVSVI